MKNSLYVYIEDHIGILIPAFLLGAGLALVYDIFRLTRTFLGCGVTYGENYYSRDLPLIGMMKKKKERTAKRAFLSVILFIFDIIYSIIFTVAFLVFFYYASDGIVRWFSLGASALGFYTYMKTVGELTKRTAGLILFAVVTVFRYLIFFTVAPLRRLFETVKKIIKKIVIHFANTALIPLYQKRSLKRIKNYTETHLKEKLSKLLYACGSDENKEKIR